MRNSGCDYASIRDVLIPYYKKENGLRILSFPILPGNIVLWPISGGNISLSIFGRPWCAPCKAEIPYLQELEVEFQGEEIEFVSISIDENRKKWKEYVREHQLGGVQLWAGDWSRLPEELHVGSIPRFILTIKRVIG